MESPRQTDPETSDPGGTLSAKPNACFSWRSFMSKSWLAQGPSAAFTPSKATLHRRADDG